MFRIIYYYSESGLKSYVKLEDTGFKLNPYIGYQYNADKVVRIYQIVKDLLSALVPIPTPFYFYLFESNKLGIQHAI